MSVQEVSFLRNPAYRAVSITHFFVDVLNNSRTLIVALLAVSLGLSNAQVGIAVLAYNIGSALSQPLFGLAADRYGPRWPVVGGMAWMIALYSLAAIGSDWVALVAVTIAGLGSGAFHPAGAKVASETVQKARTQATGFFFAAGQTGLFIGPILAGVILDAYDRPGFLVVPLLALVAVFNGWRSILAGVGDQEEVLLQPVPSPMVKPRRRRFRATWPRLSALTIVIVCTSTTAIAIINFAPKLFAEQGYSAAYVGWMAGLYMLGSAVGGIVGGALADRSGRRLAIMLGFGGALLPIYFYIPAGDPWRFPLLLLSGFFAGMPHSVLVILAQSFMPARRALASGLILGLMFFAGAVGSYLLGIIADNIGLDIALQGVVLLPLIGFLATPLLPNRRAT